MKQNKSACLCPPRAYCTLGQTDKHNITLQQCDECHDIGIGSYRGWFWGVYVGIHIDGAQECPRLTIKTQESSKGCHEASRRAGITQKGTECIDKNEENHCLLDQQNTKTTEAQKELPKEIKGKPEERVTKTYL